MLLAGAVSFPSGCRKSTAPLAALSTRPGTQAARYPRDREALVGERNGPEFWADGTYQYKDPFTRSASVPACSPGGSRTAGPRHPLAFPIPTFLGPISDRFCHKSTLRTSRRLASVPSTTRGPHPAKSSSNFTTRCDTPSTNGRTWATSPRVSTTGTFVSRSARTA